MKSRDSPDLLLFYELNHPSNQWIQRLHLVKELKPELLRISLPFSLLFQHLSSKPKANVALSYKKTDLPPARCRSVKILLCICCLRQPGCHGSSRPAALRSLARDCLYRTFSTASIKVYHALQLSASAFLFEEFNISEAKISR